MKIKSVSSHTVELPKELDDADTMVISGKSKVILLEVTSLFGRSHLYGHYTGATTWFQLNPFRECSSEQNRRLDKALADHNKALADHTRQRIQRDEREKVALHELNQMRLRKQVFAPWIEGEKP